MEEDSSQEILLECVVSASKIEKLHSWVKSDIWIFLYLDNFVGLNVSKSLKRNLRKKKIFQISNLSDHYQLQYAFLQITEISKVKNNNNFEKYFSIE